MFNKTTFENSRAGGIGVLEIADEKKAKNNEFIFAALRRTELTGEIAGPMAALCLTQTYRFSKEQCDKVLEARYRFPLPGDAAVTGVKVTFGDTEIQTELKGRQEAKDEYKEAKKAGEKAVMVTRESPDVFTICIAGLEPDTDIKIETRYVQLSMPEGIGWSIRVPLTTAPRYVRKDEYSSRHAHGQPLAVLRDPGHRFAMDLKISGASSVESPTHRLNMAVDGDALRVKLQEGEVVPDRDCVLAWKPKQDSSRPLMQVVAQEDAAANETYFLAWLAPPKQNGQRVPGEYVILVDHSGSMGGAKWAAADWAVEKFLLGLGEGDHFTLGLFHNETRWFSKNLVAASADSIRKAVDFLKANKDDGGTELGVAMEQALNIKKLKGDVSRHLLLITDAEVSDEGRILRLVDGEYRRQDRRRISLLCIDAAPNSYLANQIAERGGGIAKFLTSDPAEGDISTALDTILEDWSSPVLAGIRLNVDRPGLYSANKNVVTSKGLLGHQNGSYVDVGDLTTGRTVWVSGRVSGPIGQGMTFDLGSGSGEKLASVTLSSNSDITALKPLYGSRMLAGLEFLIHGRYAGKELQEQLEKLGYDPEVVMKSGKPTSLYPENNKVNEVEALRDFIVKESLSYGLPSSETALIAVYHKAGKKVEATALVPNALPEGWSSQFETADMNCCKSAPMAAAPAGTAFGLARSAMKPMKKMVVSKTKDICLEEPCEITQDAYVHGALTAFSGIPAFTGAEAIIYDAALNGYLDQLTVVFPDGTPASIDPGISILVFVDDMSVPRAKVRLADLVRQRGVRPLNITVSGAVRLVLSDPAGAWAKTAPKLEVSLNLQ